MARQQRTRRTIWGQLTAAKQQPAPAVPATPAADAKPEEPTLSELQRRRIMSEARQIAQAAMAEWAIEHLPHSSAPRNIQVVASWLMTLRELRDFHHRVLKDGGSDRISGSVELYWGGQVSRRSYSGGSIHHMFNAAELAGTFEDSALVIADAFCDYSASDEIHEIRGSNWMLLVTVVGRGGSIEQRTYIHKAERGSFKEQVSREIGGLSEIFMRNEEERERRQGRHRQQMDAQLAVVVASALGHGKDLKRVYDAAFDEAFREKEADALRELQGGSKRRRRR